MQEKETTVGQDIFDTLNKFVTAVKTSPKNDGEVFFIFILSILIGSLARGQVYRAFSVGPRLGFLCSSARVPYFGVKKSHRTHATKDMPML